MKKRPAILLVTLALLLNGCAGTESSVLTTGDSTAEQTTVSSESAAETTPEPGTTEAAVTTTDAPPVKVEYAARPSLLGDRIKAVQLAAFTPAAVEKPAADLSNVYLGGFDYLTEKQRAKLAENGFFLYGQWYSEFFELYEDNRYQKRANYVTVDSMMHTYHLYFAHLLQTIEENSLSSKLQTLSAQMLQTAQQHYAQLKDTEWAEAAKTELAFFAVAANLLDPDAEIPADVAEPVGTELAAIASASAVTGSAVFPGVNEDYSQFKPRGYYDSTEQLQRYFRAMMWYGRMGFRQDNETFNRAAVLITAALRGDALKNWSDIYDVTSFFAGASDDISYYEMRTVAEAVFGADYTVGSLVGNTEGWSRFAALCKELPAPAINSVPTYDSDSDEEHDAAQKGFRFMGQRFSIDAASFTQLCYRNVKENSAGNKRILPDALDFPAALGSDTALDVLKQAKKTDYPNYQQQLDMLRSTISQAPVSTWNANLYSAWIYTLLPTIAEKGTEYPFFMQSDAWRRKALVSFEGSYTELKHDTVLYSKQYMGEMGGGGEEVDYDDRGYVEAEPEVFARLQALVQATKEGLSDYGMISEADAKNLDILAELAGKLSAIAVKELSGALPTDAEFDLIRTYGGQLEHFWEEVKRAENPDKEYLITQEFPAALITDIATDPNGTCLEVATGNPLEITVVVPIDGKLHVASGAVYSFYQFEQPLADRMTDAQWRLRQHITYDENNPSQPEDQVPIPAWYSDLICENEWP